MFSSVLTIPEAILYSVKMQKYNMFSVLALFFSMCVSKQGCLYPYSLSTTEALLTESSLSAWPLHSLGLVTSQEGPHPFLLLDFLMSLTLYRFIALTHNGVKSLPPPASFVCFSLALSCFHKISDCISKNRNLCCLGEI